MSSDLRPHGGPHLLKLYGAAEDAAVVCGNGGQTTCSHAAAPLTALRGWANDLQGPLEERTRELEAANALLRQRTRDLEEANRQLQQRTLELERLALTDPLTGLFNRRAIDELFRFELKRHDRYRSPLSIGLIDIDFFKHINTEHLHSGGDEVLRCLAKVFSASVREVDSIGRVGGEEFLLLARETNEEGARRLAERVRAAVEAMSVRHHGRHIGLTVSIGMAVAEGNAPANQESMYQAAAAALAQAKQFGRNCVVVEPLPAVHSE